MHSRRNGMLARYTLLTMLGILMARRDVYDRPSDLEGRGAVRQGESRRSTGIASTGCPHKRIPVNFVQATWTVLEQCLLRAGESEKSPTGGVRPLSLYFIACGEYASGTFITAALLLRC